MSGTTSNYGFVYPSSTDYVKDGASAIQTLATGVDTAMNSALGTKPAMGVLLNASTPSGVSSLTISSVFSSTYDYYKIIIDCYGSVANYYYAQFTSSGTSSTTDYYYALRYFDTGGTTGADTNAGTSQSSMIIGYASTSSTDTAAFSLEIFDVGLANRTKVFGTNQNGGTLRQQLGLHAVATAYDGIKIFPASGTFTGKVKIYGYRNS